MKAETVYGVRPKQSEYRNYYCGSSDKVISVSLRSLGTQAAASFSKSNGGEESTGNNEASGSYPLFLFGWLGLMIFEDWIVIDDSNNDADITIDCGRAPPKNSKKVSPPLGRSATEALFFQVSWLEAPNRTNRGGFQGDEPQSRWGPISGFLLSNPTSHWHFTDNPVMIEDNNIGVKIVTWKFLVNRDYFRSWKTAPYGEWMRFFVCKLAL